MMRTGLWARNGARNFSMDNNVARKNNADTP